MSTYYIEVVERTTKKVVDTVGKDTPMTGDRADRVERGMLINMDRARFYTRQVKHGDAA